MTIDRPIAEITEPDLAALITAGDEVHDASPALAIAEAAPEVLLEIGPELGGIVSSVDGARPIQCIPAAMQPGE